MSKFAREPVTIASAVDRVTFTHVDPEISFPLPQPLADIDSYVVYVGFDPAGRAAGKEKAGGRNRKPSSEIAPRSRVKAEMPDALPAAQIDDRALERAHVGDHGAGAGGAQMIGELAAGVAAADKADHRHAGGHAGGDADR